ncbi:hypothetical protein [Nonomuraea basaltis]|uniref:hypothetical protein n=1 Tax=Nonomuraea basaltis TaxID=2495887 RepID=UPI00110C5240|nr:hypothetical protein [Nonomuraea basaltis]TMR90470.1 hypothetical protein EJK15_55260 [Nonomuraea basaltis]
MRGAVLYAWGDVRVEQRPGPVIVELTAAIIRLATSGWWRRSAVRSLPGRASSLIGSFFACANTCEICRAGYQSSCVRRVLMGSFSTQAQPARVPLAGHALVVDGGQTV